MNVPFVDLKAKLAEIEPDVRAAIDRVLESCAFASGREVAEFERRFAQYCGVRHCVGVGSGTAALELLLRACGVASPDEVILPANTFVAAAEAVALTGATPVFADVCEETANLDPDRLARAVTARTRAVLPTHLYGQPADMAPILDLARERGLRVIEDASQAHGARLGSHRVGALADAAVFSFYPAKNLGAFGEAGCATTDDDQLAERLRMLRDHGSRRKHVHECVGRNDRMDELQAAVLRVQLDRLDGWNERRREIAGRYRAALAECPKIQLLEEIEGARGVWHLFVVQCPDRDRLRERLRERGVATGLHYPRPLHLQPAFRGLGYKPGDFPVAEKLAGRVLSLPIYPQLPGEQADYVIDQLTELL